MVSETKVGNVAGIDFLRLVLHKEVDIINVSSFSGLSNPMGIKIDVKKLGEMANENFHVYVLDVVHFNFVATTFSIHRNAVVSVSNDRQDIKRDVYKAGNCLCLAIVSKAIDGLIY